MVRLRRINHIYHIELTQPETDFNKFKLSFEKYENYLGFFFSPNSVNSMKDSNRNDFIWNVR